MRDILRHFNWTIFCLYFDRVELCVVLEAQLGMLWLADKLYWTKFSCYVQIVTLLKRSKKTAKSLNAGKVKLFNGPVVHAEHRKDKSEMQARNLARAPI